MIKKNILRLNLEILKLKDRWLKQDLKQTVFLKKTKIQFYIDENLKETKNIIYQLKKYKMAEFKLSRTKQCAKCPWKVDTNPYDIPDEYCEIKHSGLSSTIAKEGEIKLSGQLSVMACHHSDVGNEQYCIGWLNHQLGIGNNILLRLKMMNCENVSEIKIYGEQHKTFENTLPK